MQNLKEIVHKIIQLRQAGKARLTLLAVCPNSSAVLEAAVKAAAANRSLMLFAATLNQVDLDSGYTGWTQAQFTAQMRSFARHYDWEGPFYPCLDHGGPWLKDLHTLKHLSLDSTMAEVKDSLTACLEASYQLLHIDATVDRSLSADEPPSIETVVERTVELIAHAEKERSRLGLPPVAYEAGSDEVHGGLVDFHRFEVFLAMLRDNLDRHGLDNAWPAFLVTQVGTDLHTTHFSAAVARKLYQTVAPMGSLIKGHYTDWVENPREYPETGMGGANVGPEFTADEYLALSDLCEKEEQLCRSRSGLSSSRFMLVLEQAVIDSGRWKKWLQPEEVGRDFITLSSERRLWLTQTGARYIWTNPRVVAARQELYANLEQVMPDPHAYVVQRIAAKIDQYIHAFGLFNSVELLD